MLGAQEEAEVEGRRRHSKRKAAKLAQRRLAHLDSDLHDESWHMRGFQSTSAAPLRPRELDAYAWLQVHHAQSYLL